MITVVDASLRANGKQHVYFTLDSYGWSDGSVPASLEGAELQTYLEGREDIYAADIARKVAAEPQFTSNHPAALSKRAALLAELEGVTNLAGLKALVRKVIEG